MNICVFSRSDGDGRATTRKTRGLTRSVIALIVPPLPAASRPSNTTITRRPAWTTHSCNRHNSVWSFRNSFSYFLRFILGWISSVCCLDMDLSQHYGLTQRAFQPTWHGVTVTGRELVVKDHAGWQS